MSQYQLQMDRQYERFYYKWTDNMNVFYWIHNEGGLLKYFVLNQAGEIQTYTEPSRWRYVSTK